MGVGDPMSKKIEAGIRASKVSSNKARELKFKFKFIRAQIVDIVGSLLSGLIGFIYFQLRMIFQLFPVTVDLFLIGRNLLFNQKILRIIYNGPG